MHGQEAIRCSWEEINFVIFGREKNAYFPKITLSCILLLSFVALLFCSVLCWEWNPGSDSGRHTEPHPGPSIVFFWKFCTTVLFSFFCISCDSFKQLVFCPLNWMLGHIEGSEAERKKTFPFETSKVILIDSLSWPCVFNYSIIEVLWEILLLLVWFWFFRGGELAM